MAEVPDVQNTPASLSWKQLSVIPMKLFSRHKADNPLPMGLEQSTSVNQIGPVPGPKPPAAEATENKENY